MTNIKEDSMNAEKKPSVIRRTVRFIDKTIDSILSVLFFIVLFIGIYFTYDSWYVYNASALDHIPGYAWDGAETLEEMPTEAICWITIDDTKIDCPIMQGETNSEYLNKNPYGEYSLAGSIFLDSSNDPEFKDIYSIVYGHHMSGGYMFGALDEYEKEEYLDEHREGIIKLRNGKEIKVSIFAFVETDASNDLVFDVNSNYESNDDRLAFIKDNALVYREPIEGRIIALSTCKSPLTTDRTVVFGIIND